MRWYLLCYCRSGSGRLLLCRLWRLRGLGGHLHLLATTRVIGQRLTDTYAIVGYANAIYVALGLCPVRHTLYHILLRIARHAATNTSHQPLGRGDGGRSGQCLICKP